ncbi:hypothetical protein M408DRAFT_28088 [Serendipita vermifera MAFF 305830]|uniref:Uncharacterized protein n=1 Tax=Serendipita vermifera MAFF 305830 TaxID=933852 RepID=A0A0C2W9U5_SERVB|nr:hypothetical protein M408DRAFT_28088 [Serendipita vermifera MAFF 305830]
MSSTPTLKRLQMAHFKPGKQPATRSNASGTMYPMQSLVISHQPASSRGMDLKSNDAAREGEQQVDDGAMRLRGGCFPLPGGGTCYIIPIPCCC